MAHDRLKTLSQLHIGAVAFHCAILVAAVLLAMVFRPSSCNPWFGPSALFQCYNDFPVYTLNVAFVQCNNRTVKPPEAEYLASIPEVRHFDDACEATFVDSNLSRTTDRDVFPPAVLMPYVRLAPLSLRLSLPALLFGVFFVTVSGHAAWAWRLHHYKSIPSRTGGDSSLLKEPRTIPGDAQWLQEASWWRWAEYSASAPLMTVQIFYFCGYGIAEILGCVAVLTCACMWVGYFANHQWWMWEIKSRPESESTSKSRFRELLPAAVAFLVASATQVVQWTVLLRGRVLDGKDRSGGYVTTFVVTNIVLYALFACWFLYAPIAITCYKINMLDALICSEIGYVVLSFVAKVGLVVVLFSSILQWMNMDTAA